MCNEACSSAATIGVCIFEGTRSHSTVALTPMRYQHFSVELSNSCNKSTLCGAVLLRARAVHRVPDLTTLSPQVVDSHRRPILCCASRCIHAKVSKNHILLSFAYTGRGRGICMVVHLTSRLSSTNIFAVELRFRLGCFVFKIHCFYSRTFCRSQAYHLQ